MSAQSPSRPQIEHYNVYRVRYNLELADPDVPGPRYHNVLFVETGADGSGTIHHVVGDMVQGMTYQAKRGRRPEESASFYNKDFLGTVSASSYPGSVDAVLRAQPAPPRQKAFNVKTMRTEPVKADGTFYVSNEARPQLFKCTEWIEQRAIPSLRQAGVLEATRTSSPSSKESYQEQSRPSGQSSSRAQQGAGRASRGTGSTRGSHAPGTNGVWTWDERYQRYRRLLNGAWIWA